MVNSIRIGGLQIAQASICILISWMRNQCDMQCGVALWLTRNADNPFEMRQHECEHCQPCSLFGDLCQEL